MANLIITVIAIALVAIASLMGAYYGGSAFLNNQSAANASTVLNQAQQIAGAWNAYLSNNLDSPPTALTSLITQNYLQQIPTAPAEAGGVTNLPMAVGTASATINGTTGTHYFAYANMGAGGTGAPAVTDNNSAACLRIIKTAIGPTAANALTNIPSLAPGGIFNGTNAGNGTFGCAYTSAATTAGIGGATIAASNYVMEYLLQ